MGLSQGTVGGCRREKRLRAGTTIRRRLVALLVAVGSAAGLIGHAQMRVVPIDEEQGHVALGLALRRLANAGVLMMATAHPDDENNGLLVQLNRGQGYRTALATATRGNGGQNEIGPEIFEALGVLRTEELGALHRFDGAEQYFTRAVDFGYSFSIEETFDKWGRDEIIGDFVRLIRTIRPDVMVGMSPTGAGGGQHHQASALLSREAFKIAGDPSKYPDQIKEGLRPWQPKKYYFSTGFQPPGEPAPGGRLLRLNLASYDGLLGKTYSEIGTEARSMHKCQGMAQLLALPGPSTTAYQLVESTIAGQLDRNETSLFDGIDASLVGLGQLAGPRPPAALVDGLRAIASSVENAQRKFDSETHEATLQPLLAGLHALRALRSQLAAMAIDDRGRYDLDVRLQQKEAEFQQAILLANAIRVEALADDGVVVPGQPVKVTLLTANNGPAVSVRHIDFSGFDGNAGCVLTAATAAVGGRGGRGGGRGGRGADAPPAPPISTLNRGVVGRCEVALGVPAHARISEPYWHREGEAGRYTFDPDAPFGLPFRPTPFHARVAMGFQGETGLEEITADLPVEYRYEGNIFSGEKRSELIVVPAFSVSISPGIAIVPASSLRTGTSVRSDGASGRAARELRVTVVNDTPGAAENVVALRLPAGWTATPPQQALTFTRSDEAQTVRFALKPAPNTAPGEYHVHATAAAGGQSFDRGYQVIEYPHIRRQHIYHDADVAVKVIDVKVAAGLNVGYVVGVGDEVPPAIEQLGVRVQSITPDELAWGDLSRYDAIVTGVRAYERRADLRANNRRLLDYVERGGTLIVQYNKFEFNEAQYGPYPAQVSGNRVTDEFSPVKVLAPADPVFNHPNRITESTWKGWVQERGLYFLGDRDARYRDLVSLEDPFPYNMGEKRGALVEATYGNGHWVYVGLGLWRQLPAGTDGAYQLLANLLSLGKVSSAGKAQVSRTRAR
jgi:LmbE family N-acetylglucosaminyl deacetylase